MTSPSPGGNEIYLVLVLLCVFLGVAFYSEQVSQSVVEQTSTSTVNAHPLGTKALFSLFEAVPYKVNRLKTSWNGLGPNDGLLVVVEKLDKDRQPTPKEVTALHDWTQKGGTVLYFVDLPARPLDPADSLAGDVAIIDANDDAGEVTPNSKSSPYTQSVETISIKSKVRLKTATASSYETLFADKQGAIVVHKPLGAGHVILIANTYMVSNQGINEDDNVVFLTNIAQIALGNSAHRIQFDEYHHGLGFDMAGSSQQSILSTLALPLKRAIWPCLALFLLLLYNANRRFGIALPLASVVHRPSTDYLTSMARWYRLAHSGSIALQTLYEDFMRTLTLQLGLAPDAPQMEILGLCRQRYPNESEEINNVILRIEMLKAGTSLPDAELVAMAHQVENLKRRIRFVGNQF